MAIPGHFNPRNCLLYFNIKKNPSETKVRNFQRDSDDEEARIRKPNSRNLLSLCNNLMYKLCPNRMPTEDKLSPRIWTATRRRQLNGKKPRINQRSSWTAENVVLSCTTINKSSRSEDRDSQCCSHYIMSPPADLQITRLSTYKKPQHTFSISNFFFFFVVVFSLQ